MNYDKDGKIKHIEEKDLVSMTSIEEKLNFSTRYDFIASVFNDLIDEINELKTKK